jgi:tetratricopeptide (TPR) repeat protein
MRASPLAGAVVLLAALAGPARAADPEAARAASAEGDRSFELGKFEQAIAAYERAFSLDAQPAFIFNIALAHRRQFELDGQLDHLLRARELYRNYLRLDPHSPRRAAVEKIVTELTAKVDEAHGHAPRDAPPAPRPPPARPVALVPGPPAVADIPAPRPRSSSHAAFYVAAGAALAAVLLAGVVLVLAHDRSPSFDGPPVDLRPR